MKLRNIILSSAVLFFANNAFAQSATNTLTINIEDLETNEGTILLAICTKEEFLKAKCSYQKAVNLSDVVNNKIIIDNIASNTYAVQMFHDLNGDMQLGKNAMGIPNEPYAFSNNAKGNFGPPKFEDASIIIDKPISISISLN